MKSFLNSCRKCKCENGSVGFSVSYSAVGLTVSGVRCCYTELNTACFKIVRHLNLSVRKQEHSDTVLDVIWSCLCRVCSSNCGTADRQRSLASSLWVWTDWLMIDDWFSPSQLVLMYQTEGERDVLWLKALTLFSVLISVTHSCDSLKTYNKNRGCTKEMQHWIKF